MTSPSDQHTLDPAIESRAMPADFTRRSTLTVRRLTIGDRRVVVKIATGRTRAPLRAEASVTRLIGAELTPEVIAVREHDDRTDLVLDDVGHRTVADLAGLDAASRLAVLEASARAVDALHREGWTHGALCAEHVVLDESLGVRFVSLGSARPLSDGSDAREDDLRQLFGLVEVVGRTPMAGEVQRVGWGRTRRALRRLDSLGPSPIGSAEELARAIGRIGRPPGRGRHDVDRDDVDRDDVDRDDVDRDDLTSPPRLRSALRALSAKRAALVRHCAVVTDRFHELHGDPLRRLAKIASAVAVVVLAAVVVPRAMGTAPAASDESRLGAIEPLVDSCPLGSAAPNTEGSPDAQFDLTGDGCADLVHIDGTTVRINGVSHRVGREGDQVVLGDDDCDGIAQVHLVRPSTGEHFVFEELARAGASVHAQLRSARHATARGVRESLERCTDRTDTPSPSTLSTGDPP